MDEFEGTEVGSRLDGFLAGFVAALFWLGLVAVIMVWAAFFVVAGIWGLLTLLDKI